MGETSGSVVMHRFESRVLDPISGFGGLEYLGYLGSDVHIHIHKDIYIYIYISGSTGYAMQTTNIYLGST